MNNLSIARRAVVTCGVALTFLVGAAVAPGDPGNGAVRSKVLTPPAVLNANRCGFPIHAVPLTSNAYVIHQTNLPDGTVILRVTGNEVWSFTNMNTGKTIVKNTSPAGSPTTVTISPDGTQVIDAQGGSEFNFGPTSQANTGEPGLVFFTGHVVVTTLHGIAQSVASNGHQENGCELLS
jgi:hypothetical protein